MAINKLKCFWQFEYNSEKVPHPVNMNLYKYRTNIKLVHKKFYLHHSRENLMIYKHIPEVLQHGRMSIH